MLRSLSCLLLTTLLGCSASHVVTRCGSQICLVVEAPAAKTVAFASSADGFALLPIRRDHGGRYTATMPAAGEFSYFFVVDGRVYVPECRDREFDDFGGSNCLYHP